MNRKKEIEWKLEKSKVFLFYVFVLMYMISRKGKWVNTGEKEGSLVVIIVQEDQALNWPQLIQNLHCFSRISDIRQTSS